MKKLSSSRSLAALAGCALLLLAACGGGGDDAPAAAATGNGIRPTTALGSSVQYEGICDLETQKKFTRAYLDEVYLWYDEIVDVDASRFRNIPDYFDALLVRTPDANGVAKDRFSAVLPVARVPASPPSVAAASLALDPGLLANHTDAVPVTKVVTSPGGRRAGYIQFNDHEQGAQDDLIAAFRQIQAGNVQDLVLDLRFNTGGFLYVAQAAASMIAGPSAEGKVFERLQYNDKRDQESASDTFFFSSRVQTAETQNPVGTPLPQLDLPRVFVLTSERTCSASESIINSLRGIDVQVIRVGATTCGKPYGFRQKNNCGLAYFPIEFKGTNAKGFGDYTTGIAPTCAVQDDATVLAEDPQADPLFRGALRFIDTGACPAGTATGVQSSASPIVTPPAEPARPAWA
ncbi:S41 family peptidase, partial [Ramlibacter alkalitolerans]